MLPKLRGKQKKISRKERLEQLVQLGESLRPEHALSRYECPICGYEGEFAPNFTGHALRFSVKCPSCQSVPRNRFQALFLDQHECWEGEAKLLHFAPEKALRDFFSQRASEYITADLDPSRGDITLNIEEIALEDKSVNIVVANHVLEHVDHTKALSELFRILTPGGFAVLSFPMIYSWSVHYKDESMETKSQRHQHFGQYDHVVFFGRQIEQDMRNAGFEVTPHVVPGESAAKYGLERSEVHFVCRRPN